ncbi:hypothetical protein LOD99_12182 [Oopsacas minuta]|uniref:Basic leucine zipper domain-containing protein n=1 Tax=Oopsacas minuta TaxID=111878 RepID=A0AAV7JHM1_9METZ|nr:hypothetical protein LOD99_12182 [Oopsacas minuta]
MSNQIQSIKDLTEAEITGLGIKELNKKLRQKNYTKQEQLAIKRQRRKIKMKKYRKESHKRRIKYLNNLLEQHALLQDEYLGLKLEVFNLQREKVSLIEEISSDEDDEYGEFVIVD